MSKPKDFLQDFQLDYNTYKELAGISTRTRTQSKPLPASVDQS